MTVLLAGLPFALRPYFAARRAGAEPSRSLV
jgi:hypothetical protein